MSKQKLVTSAQTDSLRDMANAKKIGREAFQQWLDKEAPAFLDRLSVTQSQNGSMAVAPEIVPPEGYRIHVLEVFVNEDQEWQEAVNTAGPNTPQEYNVRKVGNLYPPTGKGTVKKTLVMLNYINGDGGWDKANAWATEVGLKRTVPRETFAIGAQHPNLHRQLGANPMYAVATTECAFGGRRRACDVWWHDSERRARLSWVSYFGLADGWFVFSK